MIDKSLVKKRFKKSLKTYDENAEVQKITAKKLIKMLPDKNCNAIFEAGCATGILTKEIKNSLKFNSFSANDIVEDSKSFIDGIIPDNNFIAGDIEEIILPQKYNLIISNACLQWCNDIEKTTEKLLNALAPNGILAMSIFGDENLKEIINEFDIKNKTYSQEAFKEYLSQYNIIYYEEEIIKLRFNTPVEILKHMKFTGVNAIKKINLTKSKLKDFEENYKKQYTENGKVLLTYNPVYIIISSDKK